MSLRLDLDSSCRNSGLLTAWEFTIAEFGTEAAIFDLLIAMLTK